MRQVYTLSPGLTFNGIAGETIFERFTIVPGGELHFKLCQLHKESPITLLARLNNTEDLVKLLMVGHTLKRNQIQYHLFIPYIPGGRQDRVEITGEPFSLQFYAELINQLSYTALWTYSPHSNVTTALLRDVQVHKMPKYWKIPLDSVIDQADSAWIIAPDEGAAKRTFDIFKLLKTEFPNLRFAQCLKVRNPETGLIENIKCLEENLNDLPCFIFDDICDGGRTFNFLANELRSLDSGKLYLSVDHGIFSQGTDLLKFNFETIWSTNSIKNEIPNVIINKL